MIGRGCRGMRVGEAGTQRRRSLAVFELAEVAALEFEMLAPLMIMISAPHASNVFSCDLHGQGKSATNGMNFAGSGLILREADLRQSIHRLRRCLPPRSSLSHGSER